MLFLISLILIWGISFILIIVDRGNESNRWGSGIAFVVGLRYFSDFMNEKALPYIKLNLNVGQATISRIHLFTAILTSIAFLFYPYNLIIFSLSYLKIIKTRQKRIAKILLLVPIIIIYLLFRINDFVYPTTKPTYKYFTIWASFGIFATYSILLLSYLQCKSITLKKEIFLVSSILIPTTLLGWFINFFLPMIGDKNTWRYNILVILFLSTLYGVFTIKFGLLGMRLRFERKRIDSAIKSINSGTLILTHAIKNELFKIDFCSSNIKLSQHAVDKDIFDKYIGENVRNIMTSTDHLSKLVKRIKEHMNEIVIYKLPNNIDEIIKNSLNRVMPIIINNKIIIKYNYPFEQQGIVLLCDGIHIQEVLNNILKNAIEAMKDGGEISIQVIKGRSTVTIEIRDNGPGIPKENLQYVFDPFFSTKKNKSNFGLGLSYCYNVMQKHGGTIELDSLEGKGTTVLLKFHLDKINKKSLEYEGNNAYVQNQDCDCGRRPGMVKFNGVFSK